MNAEICMDYIDEDAEIVYSEEELEGMYKEYQERVWNRFCFKKMLQKEVWI